MKTIPNSAAGFAKWLVEENACSSARTWQSGKTLNKTWKTCERGDWLLWLLNRAGYVWPDSLYAEYERQNAPLLAEYRRQRAPLLAEYERQRAPLLAEYRRQRAPLLAEYERQRAPLWSEYERQRAPLL